MGSRIQEVFEQAGCWSGLRARVAEVIPVTLGESGQERLGDQDIGNLAASTRGNPEAALWRYGCSCAGYLRNGLKLARISAEKSCGCSQAAKWPPRSSLL